MEIGRAQQLVIQNKVAKGFNTTDVPLEICFLLGEIAEFFSAWRHEQDDVGEELADVALYVLGLASVLGIDLQDEVIEKIRKNAERKYERRENGVLVKVQDISEKPRLREVRSRKSTRRSTMVSPSQRSLFGAS